MNEDTKALRMSELDERPDEDQARHLRGCDQCRMLVVVDRRNLKHENQRLVAEVERLRAQRDEALATIKTALPVVAYVSAGRGYIGVEPYPDATARKANAEMRCVLSRTEDAPTTNCAPSPDCGCSCHRMPGVSHIAACCDQPPYGWLCRTEDGTQPGEAQRTPTEGGGETKP